MFGVGHFGRIFVPTQSKGFSMSGIFLGHFEMSNLADCNQLGCRQCFALSFQNHFFSLTSRPSFLGYLCLIPSHLIIQNIQAWGSNHVSRICIGSSFRKEVALVLIARARALVIGPFGAWLLDDGFMVVSMGCSASLGPPRVFLWSCHGALKDVLVYGLPPRTPNSQWHKCDLLHLLTMELVDDVEHPNFGTRFCELEKMFIHCFVG